MRTSEKASRLPSASTDKLYEDRQSVSEAISLFLTGHQPFSAACSLVDEDSSGLRVAHNCPGLIAGEAVGFRRKSNQVRARINWTRVFEGDIHPHA